MFAAGRGLILADARALKVKISEAVQH